MKRLMTTMGFATALMAASQAPADQVAQSAIKSFSAGATASAAEVNGNFSALISAINDNAQRIGQLESMSAVSVSGRHYEMRGVGVLFRGDQTNSYVTVGNYSDVYTLAFDSTNGFTLTGHENEGEVGIPDASTTLVQDNAAQSVSGSWSQTGNVVTLNTSAGDTLKAVVTSDGSVLLSNDFRYGPNSGANASESSITIGVRQD